MADLAPPPGWDTPQRSLESQAPPVGPEGGQQIQVAPAGTDSDAGSADTIAGTVTDAIGQAMARISELASDTYEQGSVLGDLVPLPPGPDAGSSLLQTP